MTYRATVTNAIGIYSVGVAMASLLFTVAVFSRPFRTAWVLAGFAVVAIMIAIRVRYSVHVSGEELRARDLVRERCLKWHEIVRVTPASESGYWASRLFGPSVLEFASATMRLRVNFKLFSRECRKDVMAHVPPTAQVRS